MIVLYHRQGAAFLLPWGPPDRTCQYTCRERVFVPHTTRDFGVVCGPKEDFMSSSGEMHRRSFLVGASVAGGGLALGFAIPRGTDLERPPPALAEVNCWVTIAPDDAVTIRIARAEMGQGVIDQSRHAGGRGARVRLEKGPHSICVAGRKFASRPGLGRPVDRSEPLDCLLARISAPRRRYGPGNAHCGRSGALGRAAVTMPCAEQQNHAPAVAPHFALRRSRARCR